MFDIYYIAFFNVLKSSFGKKAMKLALYYVSLLELSFYVLIAAFFAAFTSQMRLGVMSKSKVLILSVLGILFICFKNWIRYNGKRRNILSAKSKRRKLKLWQLIMLPLVCLFLALIFFQAI
jgi:hypothetical protein